MVGWTTNVGLRKRLKRILSCVTIGLKIFSDVWFTEVRGMGRQQRWRISIQQPVNEMMIMIQHEKRKVFYSLATYIVGNIVLFSIRK